MALPSNPATHFSMIVSLIADLQPRAACPEPVDQFTVLIKWPSATGMRHGLSKNESPT